MSSGKRTNKVAFESPLNTSSPAACRICHSGDNSLPYWGGDFGEPLISPCNCKGTTGLLHRSCMLYWLRTNSTKCCEICKHEFKTVKVLPSFTDFLRVRGMGVYGDTSLGVDLVVFVVITAICYTAGPMLLIGAAESDGEDWLAKTLLGVVVLFMHLIWMISTITAHFVQFREWRYKYPRDIFVDKELNETLSLNDQGLLARILCCLGSRTVISGHSLLVVDPNETVSPVRSLYAEITPEEQTTSGEGEDEGGNDYVNHGFAWNNQQQERSSESEPITSSNRSCGSRENLDSSSTSMQLSTFRPTTTSTPHSYTNSPSMSRSVGTTSAESHGGASSTSGDHVIIVNEESNGDVEPRVVSGTVTGNGRVSVSPVDTTADYNTADEDSHMSYCYQSVESSSSSSACRTPVLMRDTVTPNSNSNLATSFVGSTPRRAPSGLEASRSMEDVPLLRGLQSAHGVNALSTPMSLGAFIGSAVPTLPTMDVETRMTPASSVETLRNTPNGSMSRSTSYGPMHSTPRAQGGRPALPPKPKLNLL